MNKYKVINDILYKCCICNKEMVETYIKDKKICSSICYKIYNSVRTNCVNICEECFHYENNNNACDYCKSENRFETRKDFFIWNEKKSYLIKKKINYE